MAHNDNVKTFDVVSKHLEMEDERQKSLAPPSVALVAKGGKMKGRRAISWQTVQERSAYPSKLPTWERCCQEAKG